MLEKRIDLGNYYRDSIEVLLIMQKITSGIFHAGCTTKGEQHDMIVAREALELITNVYSSKLQEINDEHSKLKGGQRINAK